MTIQHRLIPNNQLHECKHIPISTTADSGKVITPSSSVDGTSVLRRLTLADIQDSGSLDWSGWAAYRDSTIDTYTTSATLINRATSSDESNLPSGETSYWDSTNNLIVANTLGDMLQVEITLVAHSVSGDSQIVVAGGDGLYPRITIDSTDPVDSGVYHLSFLLPVTATVISSPISFQVNAVSDVTVKGSKIVVSRLHRGI